MDFGTEALSASRLNQVRNGIKTCMDRDGGEVNCLHVCTTTPPPHPHTGAMIMVHSVFEHRGIVSCIAYCQEKGFCGTEGCGFIASGSHDATVLL